MSPPNEWDMLAISLRNRYPDDHAERLASYRDGSNPDLQRWRALGGDNYTPDAPKRYPKRRPQPLFASKAEALAARNRRILAAAESGVPHELIAERFGLSPAAISAILGALKRVAR